MRDSRVILASVIKNNIFFVFLFQDKVFLCNLGCPGTRSVDQVGLKFRDPPASAPEELRLEMYTTTHGTKHNC